MKTMTQKIRGFIAAGLFAIVIGGAFGATIPSGTVNAADCSGNNAFLTFPAWYRGIAEDNGNNGCDIVAPDGSQSNGDGIAQFVWAIVLNVTEIALQLIAYIAAFLIIFGGFQYMTSAGSADQAAKALKTIINALIGLAIAVGSVAIVNLVLDATNLRNAAGNDYGIVEQSAASIIQPLLGVVYWVAGIVSVVVIVLAGLSYATSGGNSGKVAKAKNSILYGVIGLVIVIMAFTITNFIIGRLGG